MWQQEHVAPVSTLTVHSSVNLHLAKRTVTDQGT